MEVATVRFGLRETRLMFTCQNCGKSFELRQDILDKYPGWTPKECLDCRQPSGSSKPGGKPSEGGGSARSVTKNKDLPTASVLAMYTDGPKTGAFTDGAAEGNPGPGGWGAVLVVDDAIVSQDYGSETFTTNNRMELTAMISALKMIPNRTPADIYTDSQLVVNILTQWAKGWEEKGWKKTSPGPIANLELVKEAYSLVKQKPEVNIHWIRAHSGSRWNEYADALATAYRREEF
jgi:ribonuclease HI